MNKEYNSVKVAMSAKPECDEVAAKFHQKAEQKMARRKVFEGRVMRIEQDTVVLPNGALTTREVVRHPGGVCVLPLTDDGQVLLVRQFRYPEQRSFIELPAGKLEEAERREGRFVEAALRELREETGTECRALTHIGDFYPSPAILDEVIHMYLAEGLTFGEQALDDDEFLDVVSMPLSDLCDKIVSGEITDGKTQAAALKVKYMLDRR